MSHLGEMLHRETFLLDPALILSLSDQCLAGSISLPALSCSSTSFAYLTLSKVRLIQPGEMHWEAPGYSQGVISIAANSHESTRELRTAKSSRAPGEPRAASDGMDPIS